MANPSHRHPRFLFREQMDELAAWNREAAPKTEPTEKHPESSESAEVPPRPRLLTVVARALAALL
jgi:hypothetical protein